MKKIKFSTILLITCLIASISITSCKQKTTESNPETIQPDLTKLEKEFLQSMRILLSKPIYHTLPRIYSNMQLPD